MTDDRGRMSVFFCDNSTGEGKVTEAVYPSSVDRLPSSELAAACASLPPRYQRTEDGQIDPSSVFCLPSSDQG